MNNSYFLAVLLTTSLVTAALRFTPSLLFRHRQIPHSLVRIGKILPEAMMAVLVVYCVKDAQFFYGNYALPEILAILSCVFLYLWKKNAIVAIGFSTAFYMILVQTIFL